MILPRKTGFYDHQQQINPPRRWIRYILYRDRWKLCQMFSLKEIPTLNSEIERKAEKHDSGIWNYQTTQCDDSRESLVNADISLVDLTL